MAPSMLPNNDPLGLIRQLMTQFAQPLPEPDFSSATSFVDKLQQQAEQIKSQFNTQLAAPEPDTLRSDFIQRALAGASDSLTGGNQLGAANTRIEQTRAERLTHRIQNLKMLSDTYSEAADRAAKAGDMVEEQKLRAKIEANHNRLEQLTQLREGAATLERSRQSDLDRQSAERRARLEAGTRIRVADIEAAAKDKLAGLDPLKRGIFDNLMSRAKRIEDARDELVNKTNKKGQLILSKDKKAQAQADAYDQRLSDLYSQAHDLLNGPSAPSGPQSTATLLGAPQVQRGDFMSAQPPAAIQQPSFDESDVLANLISGGKDAQGNIIPPVTSYAQINEISKTPGFQTMLNLHGLSRAKFMLLARKQLVQTR